MRVVTIGLVLIFAALQMRIWAGTGSYSEISRLGKRIDEQIQENIDLETRNNELFAEVNELKTGMDGIEEIARNDLGLIKKGETFYLIVDDD